MADQIVRLGPEYFPRATSGVPISGGSIFIGLPDTDPEIEANQIQVSALQENGTTVPITQPILTSGGGVPLYNGAPVTLLVSESYSLKVLDAFDVQIYNVPSTTVPVDTIDATVESVEDIIGLIDISSPIADQTHIVLSFFEDLNKGGGTFYWDSTADKATANGGTIIDPDTIGGFDGTTSTLSAFLTSQGTGVGNGCWVRDLTTIITVESFGAVADWSDATQMGTDDSDPILANIAYAKGASSSTNFILGKNYRFTQNISLAGDEFIRGNGAFLIKDFAGVGMTLTGGPKYNHVFDLTILTSTDQTAIEYDALGTDHGILIDSNRSELVNVRCDGHKGWGFKLSIETANGNKPMWRDVEARSNGTGGVGVFGTQNDNSVGIAEIRAQFNFGHGFFTATDSTLRQWNIWLYSESNWQGYSGATVFGVEINFAASCILWVYSEEQGADVSEILMGENTTFCEITSSRSNLDSDTSLGNSNRWVRGHRIGGPDGESGATRRRILSSVDYGAGARHTSSDEYIQREFASSTGTFGYSRGQGDIIAGQARFGSVSPDGFTEVSVADGIRVAKFGEVIPIEITSNFQPSALNHVDTGAHYNRVFRESLKSESLAISVVDLSAATATGTVTVTADRITTLSTIWVIDFQYLDGVLTQSDTKKLGDFTNAEVALSVVGTVLTVTLTESIGAQTKFSGAARLDVLKY